MSGVDVRFLGTGDAFGSGGRFHTASLLTSSETRVLVDCGPSTLGLLRAQHIEPAEVETIVLTHLHGDHFGGIAYVLMDAHFASGRTKDLCIAGPPGLAKQVELLHDVIFPGTGPLPFKFGMRFVEWQADTRLDLGSCQVTPYLVKHSPTMPCFGLRIEFGGRTLAYSGDTEWTPALPILSRDSDMFLCESFGYDWAPPGHLTYQTLHEHRAEFSSRRMLLTHMGEDMLAKVAGLDCASVHDGLIIHV
jgi:ribonuclease BN (tRNA processing enzyme)